MRCLWILALGLLTACPGELVNPERFSSCAPGAVETLLRQKCATAGCHGAVEPAAALDLSSTGVAARLVGQTAQTGGACDGRMLVDPNDPSSTGSLLLDKIDGEASCGSAMPFGAPALAAADLACVERWLEDAAMGAAP